MSDINRGGRTGRSRVERIYSARASEETLPQEEPLMPPNAAVSAFERPRVPSAAPLVPAAPLTGIEPDYQPNEPYAAAYAKPTDADKPRYTPNEDEPLPDMPEPVAPIVPDYSAYYRAGADAELDADGQPAQPAYAPPQRLELYGAAYAPIEDEPYDEQAPQAPVNVYSPRKATWAETARQSALSQNAVGYEVQEEPELAPEKSKGSPLRIALIALAVLCVLGGAAYLLREPLGGLIGQLTGAQQSTELPFEAVSTPAPVRGYDEAPAVELGQRARQEISAICGTVDMQTDVVTEQNVLTRTLRADGLYDYYLFAAGEGRLLCYFEGLGELDASPVDGGFYVDQAPYLVNADGSAMIRLDGLEGSLRQELRLQPIMNGWAIVSDMDKETFNYLNVSGQAFSTLWFSRAYPFTGDRTVAYMDTGVADSPERYVLYALSAQGDMQRWLEAGDMTDVAASACSAVYMKDGSLYRLDALDAPIATTRAVTFYPDCDAMVVEDPDTGKLGLYVRGEKHYDYLYDDIKPVECDIQWMQKTYGAQGGTATIRVVTGAAYPQPLTHYFELSRDGQKEYVALSTPSSCPILLSTQP